MHEQAKLKPATLPGYDNLESQQQAQKGETRGAVDSGLAYGASVVDIFVGPIPNHKSPL